MKSLLTEFALISVFFWGFAPGIQAGPGHEGHEETPRPSSHEKNPKTVSENSFLIGSSFEVVLNVCEKDKIRLYVADRETNQSISKAAITIQGSGSRTFKSDAFPTQQEGEYVFVSPVKEGDKIELKISIKETTRAEILSTLIAHWPKTTGQCQEKKHD